MRPQTTPRSLLTAALTGLLLVAAPAARAATRASDPADAARLGRGINALGFDPLWSDPKKARFGLRHLRAIRAADFSTVRVNLFTFPHLDAENRLDPNWLLTLDSVVQAGVAEGLNLVLEVQDMKACAEDVDGCRPKLLAVWRQLAERYRGASHQVLFEPLNEPNGALDAVWNDRLAEILAAIRETNPTRDVVVDAVGWANVANLPKLQLPAGDRHLIASFHYYDPHTFTHQGAPWEPATRDLSGVRWGSAADRARVRADFAAAKAWSRANRRPVFVGEFGVYERADMASRTAYLAAVAREAERQGFPWADWQFDSDFAAWDHAREAWIAPVLQALIPPAPRLRRR